MMSTTSTALPFRTPQTPRVHRRTSGAAPVIAVVSRKGGPGKTTIAAHLLYGLALRGYAVAGLEIEDRLRLHAWLTGFSATRGDAPLQDNQTTYALLTHPELGMGAAPYAIDAAAALARVPSLAKEQVSALAAERGWSGAQGFDFLPGSRRLRMLESTFLLGTQSTARADFDPYTQLAKALELIRPRYDLVVMDTPPSLATIQYNVLMAATHLLLVVDFDADSIEDYHDTRDFYRDVCAAARQMGRPLPQVLGVVLNKYDASFEENDVRLLRAYTRPHLDPELGYEVPPLIEYPALGVIPLDRRRLVGAMNQRVTVHTFAPTSELGRAFYDLCRQVEAGVGLA